MAHILQQRFKERDILRRKRHKRFRMEVNRRLSEWSRSKSRPGSRISLVSREEMEFKRQEIESFVRAEQADEVEAELKEEALD